MNKTVVISANTSWYLYNFRKNTMTALMDIGYNVIAVSPKDEFSDKIEELGVRHIDIFIDQGGMNPVKDFYTFISFIRIYSKLKPSVVLNFTPKNNIYSTIASHLNNSKSINNIAGLGTIFINKGIVATIVKALYRFSQSYASTVFFQNDDDKAIFIQNKIVPVDIVDRLPGSGADLNRFQLVQAPNDGIVRFLLVARMLYDKGIKFYVDAARILKQKYGSNVEFYLLGFLDVDNPSAVSSEDMNSWVNEGVIEYLGVSDKVEDEIAKIDCMVLPSFYREGVPKSLLEAGAMGKPIITTDSVGCRETVDHNVNGYICKPRDLDSLVEQLNKFILLSHDERLLMGQASRNKVEEEFDEKIVIEKYSRAIQSCVLS
ncbi:glycosyltransferase family 4 protein [Photobacterium minamisatsumaniensis]|uniref:glycosyltransferase family 4 protein n=1 Tax=Photobacterium minamisatsumaniensis TaxID=2910233 RepID=UPI003D0EA041